MVLATRNSKFYYKDYVSTNTLPAVAAYGTAWTGYTEVGLTTGGIDFTTEMTRGEIRADQLFDPVDIPVTGRTTSIGSGSLQPDPLLMKEAAGFGTTATVAPITGVRGTDTWTISSGIPSNTYKSLGAEFQQQNGEALQFLVIKGVPTGNPSVNIGQAENPASYRFEVQAVPPGTGATHGLALVRRITPSI